MSNANNATASVSPIVNPIPGERRRAARGMGAGAWATVAMSVAGATGWVAMAQPVAPNPMPVALVPHPDSPRSKSVPPGILPSAPADDLVETVRQSRRSDGFEARMTLTAVDADGNVSAAVRISIVGTADGNGERLRVRGISPSRWRDRTVLIERTAGGFVRAVAVDPDRAGASGGIDPQLPLFDSALVPWDLVAPWWSWPVQRRGDDALYAGRACTTVWSHAPLATANIRDVASCVDGQSGVAVHTRLFDARHVLRRTIAVEHLVRQDGGWLAQRVAIDAGDGAPTRVDVYAGDAHYTVPVDTFDVLLASPPATR